ncbi:hypothetical protein [Streptomyces sp. RerS4]|uniref:hypothetical protein n=1 Tax=Streptomyces sp. RerS4 TaxID=2942449 RepID=UPI00201C87B0|nr:hypothetical protein [Streptomyces sp. RerS4]UQX02953.1 hypothetical protein M4D82_22510 [Streptomyces sp. RerS4]
MRRAQTLIRLAELRGDAGPLHEARAALEAAVLPEEAPGAPGAHPDLQLALGRVLLALLPHTPDPRTRTPLAEQAASRLGAALAALLDGGPPAEAGGRVGGSGPAEPDGPSGAVTRPGGRAPGATGSDGAGDGPGDGLALGGSAEPGEQAGGASGPDGPSGRRGLVGRAVRQSPVGRAGP